jgi:hypothetical protein
MSLSESVNFDANIVHALYSTLVMGHLVPGERPPPDIENWNAHQIRELVEHGIVAIAVLSERTAQEVIAELAEFMPDDEDWQTDVLPRLVHAADQKAAQLKDYWRLQDEEGIDG